MCIMGGGSGDNGAAAARAAEAERQARIASGTSQINNTFGQFNDDYYQGVEDAANGYYQPQIQDQYEKARRQLVLNLARSGTLNGSAGARALGDLDKDYATKQADYSNQAVGYANQQRGAVEDARTQLMSQLNASADPSAIGAAAASRAQGLTAPPTFSPLGRLFGDFANLGATNVLAARNWGTGPLSPLFSPDSRSSRGSETIVRT